MDDTWVPLRRSLVEAEIFADANVWKIWTWLLMRASYKQRTVSIPTGRGNTTVHLNAGELVYGRNSASDALSMPPATVQRRIERLATLGAIKLKTITHYSIITVCDWPSYGDGVRDDRSTNREGNRDGNGHIQEGKKDTKGKKKRSIAHAEHFSEWWSIWPRKIAKVDAERAYPKALEQIAAARKITATEAAAWLLNITARYAPHGAAAGAFCPYPATWLNAERYLDDPSTWAAPPTNGHAMKSLATPANAAPAPKAGFFGGGAPFE